MSSACAAACVVALTVLAVTALSGFEEETNALRQCIKTVQNRKTCIEDFSNEVTTALIQSGGNETVVTESSIRELVQAASEDAVLAAMQVCAGTPDECLSAMTMAKMETTGMNESDITGFALCMEVETAVARKIAASMSPCMENVSAAQVREACKNDATAVVPFIMQAGNLCREREGEARWLGSLFEEAAVLSAKDACEACETAGDCDDMVAEAVGRALGKGRANLMPGEATRFQNMAVTRAVVDAVRGCVDAKKDNVNSTCDEPASLFWGCGKTRPSDDTKAKTQEGRFREETAAGAAAEEKQGCFRTKSASDQVACFSASTSASRSLIEELVRLPGMTSARLSGRADQLERRATRLALGDELMGCKKAASSPEDHETCDETLRAAMIAAGAAGDLGDLLQQYYADVLQGWASNCGIADAKECRKMAKDEAKASGMEVREYGVVRKLGAMRGAAEEWAACTQAGGTSAACRELALQQFATVSGVNASFISSKTMAQAENLGSAFLQGLRLTLIRRKRLQVATATDNITCADVLEDQMATMCEEAALQSGTRGNITKRPCRLVEEVAEYGAYFAVDLEDPEIATLSDAVAARLQRKEIVDPTTLRLQERNFSTIVQQAYASQDVAECALGDVPCKNDEIGDPPPAPAPPEAATDLAAGTGLLTLPILAAVVLARLSVAEL